MRKLIIPILAAGLLAGVADAQELKAKPGNWETTTVFSMSMKMNGQDMNIPQQTITSTQCLKPEDASFKPSDLTREGCTTSNVVSTANSMSFDLVCAQNGATMTGKMKFEVDDSRSAGKGTMTMKGDMGAAGSMNATGNMVSKRVGDC